MLELLKAIPEDTVVGKDGVKLSPTVSSKNQDKTKKLSLQD